MGRPTPPLEHTLVVADIVGIVNIICGLRRHRLRGLCRTRSRALAVVAAFEPLLIDQPNFHFIPTLRRSRFVGLDVSMLHSSSVSKSVSNCAMIDALRLSA